MRPGFIFLNLGSALAGALLTAVFMQSVSDTQQNNLLIPSGQVLLSPSPPIVTVTSNEDPQGNRSLFHFSPHKQQIAFFENVFAEYGTDYDRYYAITVFDLASQEERRIFIGTYKTSRFEWLDDETIRVFLNAGTGVRAYHDVAVQRAEPLVVKDYIDRGEASSFWIPDQEYVQAVVEAGRAEQVYREFLGG